MIEISRVQPGSSFVELPWRNRAHQFVVKRANSKLVMVPNYASALAYVQMGFSIRMSDGRSPPTLVTPGSLTFKEVPEGAADKLWRYTMPKPRFSRDALERDIAATLIGLGREAQCLAGPAAAKAYLGVSLEEVTKTGAPVDLTRSRFARLVLAAFDSAFRTGESKSLAPNEIEELAMTIAATFAGAKRCKPNPVDQPGSTIRQTMLCAYWRPLIYKGTLFEDDLVSTGPVTRLAILSAMSDAGVRNALSKIGVSLPLKFKDYERIIDWLQARQGFVPLREDERSARG